MVRARGFLGTVVFTGFVTVAMGGLGAACGGGGDGGAGATDAVEITLEGTSELFPTLDYSTGLLPANQPVQASFSLSAKGVQKVSAVASPSGSKSAPVLTGLPGRGKIALDGGFFMVGQLKIDIPNVPKYDGPIPGIENIEIPIKGEAEFDPFSIDAPVSVHADIPPSKLPGIPLPAPIPGQLILEVAEGSTVDLTFTGKCAGVDGANATYDGRIERAGSLVIKPSIEIDVPLLGTQTFKIDGFTLDLALGGSDLAMSTPIDKFGGKPAKGDEVTGSCHGNGTGGHGTGGNGTTGSTTSTGTNSGTGGTGGTGTGSTGTMMACTTAADCGGLPCLEGVCSPGGGVCQTGISFNDAPLDMCISNSCCQEMTACLAMGTQACLDCVNAGGAACSAFSTCAAPCFGTVCNSGVAVGADPGTVACLSMNCCVEFNACTHNGTDPQGCIDCFGAGAGAGTVCEDASNCSLSKCGF